MEEFHLIFYKSDSEGEDNPMVSEPIKPLAIQMEIIASRSGAKTVVKALIDSGCTKCMASLQTVQKLGLWVRKLCQSMRFKQVDGSIMGGLLTSYLTEPMRLRLANYKEIIQFVVTPQMAEAVILGLSWLTKWDPNIRWGNMAMEKYPPTQQESQTNPNHRKRKAPSTAKPRLNGRQSCHPF